MNVQKHKHKCFHLNIMIRLRVYLPTGFSKITGWCTFKWALRNSEWLSMQPLITKPCGRGFSSGGVRQYMLVKPYPFNMLQQSLKMAWTVVCCGSLSWPLATKPTQRSGIQFPCGDCLLLLFITRFFSSMQVFWVRFFFYAQLYLLQSKN